MRVAPTDTLEPYPARSGFLVPWQAEILARWRTGTFPLGGSLREDWFP